MSYFSYSRSLDMGASVRVGAHGKNPSKKNLAEFFRARLSKPKASVLLGRWIEGDSP